MTQGNPQRVAAFPPSPDKESSTMRTLKHTSLAVVAVAALSATAACGSSDTSSKSDTGTNGAASASSTAKPASGATTKASAASTLVGPGCAAYAQKVPNGAGSVQGMAQDPVATAASNNPLLTTLVKAVSGKLNPKVNLVDTLNGGQFTVFAPVDSAFAKLPKATVAALGKPAGADTLSKVLTYHVVPGQISPAHIAGSQTTVEGAKVTVKGQGDNLTVNGARVICGGVKTANATVYLIDQVLMPPM
jgi:uncharacterized surface protein with fasciclin (FAS1) repeats